MVTPEDGRARGAGQGGKEAGSPVGVARMRSPGWHSGLRVAFSVGLRRTLLFPRCSLSAVLASPPLTKALMGHALRALRNRGLKRHLVCLKIKQSASRVLWGWDSGASRGANCCLAVHSPAAGGLKPSGVTPGKCHLKHLSVGGWCSAGTGS